MENWEVSKHVIAISIIAAGCLFVYILQRLSDRGKKKTSKESKKGLET